LNFKFNLEILRKLINTYICILSLFEDPGQFKKFARNLINTLGTIIFKLFFQFIIQLFKIKFILRLQPLPKKSQTHYHSKVNTLFKNKSKKIFFFISST
jgi:hypothetical protein